MILKAILKVILKSTVSLCFFCSISFGETQNSPTLNNIPVDTEQETTISVKKGSTQSAKKIWEVQNGTAEIEGDPELMEKEARQSWKKACADWKKELKELNVESKVMNLSCNSPKCEKTTASSVVQFICKSTANYTLKVKVLE